jgi:hypothetical protein
VDVVQFLRNKAHQTTPVCCKFATLTKFSHMRWKCGGKWTALDDGWQLEGERQVSMGIRLWRAVCPQQGRSLALQGGLRVSKGSEVAARDRRLGTSALAACASNSGQTAIGQFRLAAFEPGHTQDVKKFGMMPTSVVGRPPAVPEPTEKGRKTSDTSCSLGRLGTSPSCAKRTDRSRLKRVVRA